MAPVENQLARIRHTATRAQYSRRRMMAVAASIEYGTMAIIRWRVPQIDLGRTQLNAAAETNGAKAKMVSKINDRESARGHFRLLSCEINTAIGIPKIRSTTPTRKKLIRSSA